MPEPTPHSVATKTKVLEERMKTHEAETKARVAEYQRDYQIGWQAIQASMEAMKAKISDYREEVTKHDADQAQRDADHREFIAKREAYQAKRDADYRESVANNRAAIADLKTAIANRDRWLLGTMIGIAVLIVGALTLTLPLVLPTPIPP